MASRDERPLSRVPSSVWVFFAFLLALQVGWRTLEGDATSGQETLPRSEEHTSELQSH